MPTGWPAGVHPPGTEDFEATSVEWLLDVLPPECRQYDVLRSQPAALASFALHYSRSSLEGARQAYRAARDDLAGDIPPHAVDSVLAALRVEGRRLAATARAVELVERAIRSAARGG